MTDEEKLNQVDRALQKTSKELEKLESMDAFFLEKIGMEVEELELLRSFYPEITAGEIIYANRFQKEYGLSIAKRQVWLVRRGGKVTVNGKEQWIEKYEPMVGIEGAREASRFNSQRLGIPYKLVKTGYELREVPVLVPVEPTQENPAGMDFEMKKLLVGWAEIDFGEELDEVARMEVLFSECAQKTNKGKYTKFWKEMPTTMIQKVAEYRLLKKVYGLSALAIEEDFELNLMGGNSLPEPSNHKEISKLQEIKLELQGGKVENEPVEPKDDTEPKELPMCEGEHEFVDGKCVNCLYKEEVTEPVEDEDDTEPVEEEKSLSGITGTSGTTSEDDAGEEEEPEPEPDDDTLPWEEAKDTKEEGSSTLSESEKFKIILEEANIDTETLLGFVKDVKGIKVKSVDDIIEGKDFARFRAKIVSNKNNLLGILNYKKGFVAR